MSGVVLLAALMLAPTAQAGPARGLKVAQQKGKTDKLVKSLSNKHGYARELAARMLASLEPTAAGSSALLGCVQASDEKGYVRAACAFALSRWKVKEADEPVISAMEQVDPESRYWMAEALYTLGTKAARNHVASLQSDSDIFLSSSAREWSQ